MRVLTVFNTIGSVLLLTLAAVVLTPAQTGSQPSGERPQIARLSGGARIVDSGKAGEAPGRERFYTEVEAEVAEEENAIISIYTSYLSEYRLGPSDVITIEVFGQCPDYCKTAITVPPTAKISYPLIRDGVFVGGKTVQEVADEMSERLKDFIIEPKVTVSLERPMSNKYTVIGKVPNPGVRAMERRMNIVDAINEAGGVQDDGNRKKVLLIRFDEQGNLTREEVNVEAILKGKAEMVFLNSGDQVYVPEKNFRFGVGSMFRTLERVAFLRYFFGFPL